MGNYPTIQPPTPNPIIQLPTPNPIIQPPTPNPTIQPPTPNPLKQPCNNFQKEGKCSYGDKCRYSHSNPTIQPPTPNPPKQPCNNFQKEGKCSYGDKCRYSHSNPRINQSNPKKKIVFNEILRYVTSEQGAVEKVKCSHSFNGYKYKVSQDSRVTLVKTTTDTSPPSTSISARFIYCVKDGVIPFDPFRMYDNTDKLFVQYNLDLTATKIREIKLPFVSDALKFRFTGSTIIYFIPYKVQLDKPYFQSVRVYRWNEKSSQYEFCFNYESPDFHITCASSTFDYLVLSRLPYHENELTIQMEKERIQKSLIEDNQRLLEELQRLQNEVESAKKAAELQEQRRKMIEEQRRRAEQWRLSRDPVDFFIWDAQGTPQPTYRHILEYKKPADQVQVLGQNLYLVKDGGTHHFKILIKANDLKGFPRRPDNSLKGFPLHPNEMCPSF